MKKIILTIVFILSISKIFAQRINEKIIYKSANPFSFHDIITNLNNQEEQEVYGNLVIPYNELDSIKKYPLIIGVAEINYQKKNIG